MLPWKSLISLFTRPPFSVTHSSFCDYVFHVYSHASNGNHFSTITASRSFINNTPPVSSFNKPIISRKNSIKLRSESPEWKLRRKLDMCTKSNDIVGVLHRYFEAMKHGFPLSAYHYNCVLYLCSSRAVAVICDDSEYDLGSKRGFEIFGEMKANDVEPNEATFTNMARLAARTEDPEMAFEMVKEMKNYGLIPKLRSYEPALHGFCIKGEAEKAYQVTAHMSEHGVLLDESGISALLKVSSDYRNAEKVYEMLHNLRCTVTQVAETSGIIVENWFKSEAAEEVGEENWDVKKVREGVQKGGGGWHGQGWLGSGKWNVVRSGVNKVGVCNSCGEKLASIDIDPLETENFASSVANLACQNEKAKFTEFQEWLRRNGPFDAIVDGANACLLNQHGFNFSDLKSVVNAVCQMSSSKKHPLIILHRNRVYSGPALNPNHIKMLSGWMEAGVLYVTPVGSNDDWYWLYAAVSLNCLVVTNDEMRDHLFQILGSSFFSRWKEKHQVRFRFTQKHRPTLYHPQPYSVVTQESERGSWHVPTVVGDDIGSPRQWVCATRPRAKAWFESHKSLSSFFM